MDPVMTHEDDAAAQRWLDYMESVAVLETSVRTVTAREVWIMEYTKLQSEPPRWHSHPWILFFMKAMAA